MIGAFYGGNNNNNVLFFYLLFSALVFCFEQMKSWEGSPRTRRSDHHPNKTKQNTNRQSHK